MKYDGEARFESIDAIPVRSRVSFETISIEGSEEFIDRTRAALELLKKTDSYQLITPYLGAIVEAKRSGMKAYLSVPTFEVGKMTWRSNPITYASSIAHDGFHSVLYHQAKMANGGTVTDHSTWTGTEAERRCMEFEIITLNQLKDHLGLVKKVVCLMNIWDLRIAKVYPIHQKIPYKFRFW